MIGKTLGHYQIDSKLGAGGMGVVYKARDTRLNRFVALKLLPSEKVANEESKRRFAQEARAASALSHPNIVHIYEIDEANGVEFIAMEYVEGKTLDELIGRKPLRTGEVLDYAVQIADALAAAHAAGIVHRDIKPRNIIVSDKGLVKVLDFGLAKLREPVEADAAFTQTIGASTEEGVIMGTTPYMSPEQAEGKKVDWRSDIFSFGSVLYEMMAGQPAFQGDTKISTLSAILHQEPKRLSQVLGSGSSEIERAISLCHRKDPSRRFQHMEDVKALLQSMKEESDSNSGRGVSELSTRPARGRSRYVLPLAAGVILIATASGVSWRLTRRAPTAFRAPILTRLTSDAGLTTDPALSPDGKLLAFASDRSGEDNLDIWVRQIAGGEAIRLTTDSADDHEPAFSPDGSKIAFRSERPQGAGVYVVSTLGGEARLIAAEGRTPEFSPDGTQIAYWVGVTGATWLPGHNKLYVVPSTGGPPRRIQPKFASASYPTWLSNGKHLLFLGMPDFDRRQLGTLRNADWYVAPLDGGAAIKTGAYSEFQRQGFVQTERVDWRIVPDVCSFERNACLFAAKVTGGTNLWEIPFLPSSWKTAGSPRRLTSGTTLEIHPSVQVMRGGEPGKDEGEMRVAFASLNENVDIWSLPLDSNRRTVTGSPQPLTTDLGEDIYADISRDGTKLAFVSARSGNAEIWLKDLRMAKETQVTASGGRKTSPAFSTSALKLAYTAREAGEQLMYVVSLSQSGQPSIPRKVCSQCGTNPSWSPDDKSILNVERDGSVRLVDTVSGQKTTVIEHQEGYSLLEPTLSRDGAWLSFIAHASARSRVNVIAFRAGELHTSDRWIAVTDGSSWDDTPRWSPDGKAIYFISERDGFRCIWSQVLDSATKQPVGSPVAVYHSHSARRSLLNVSLAVLSIAVANDKIVFNNMGERTGNIWMADLEARR